MPFSDARNERDRADTGRNSANHGGGNARDAADRNRAAMFGGGFGSGARGTLGQQQDRRNLEAARKAGNVAPGVRDPRASPYDSRTINSRYNQNLIASGPLTPHNVWEAYKAMPFSGIGAVSTMLGAVGVPGLGPQYEGVSPRSATGFSYDGPNRFSVNGSAMFPNQQSDIQPVQAAGAAPPPPAPMQQGMVPAATLGGPITGLGSYGMNLPSYGYFGAPGQVRPQRSAILNP